MSRGEIKISYVKDKDIQARFLEVGELFVMPHGGGPRIVTSTTNCLLFSRSVVTGKSETLQRTSFVVCKLKTQR